MATKPIQTDTAKIFRRRKQLERDLEHITQEMYRRNRTLAETNRTLSLLQTIDSLALESQDSLRIICSQVAKSITDTTDLPLVAILTSSDGTNGLLPSGWSDKTGVLDKLAAANVLSKFRLGTDWLLDETRSKLISLNPYGAGDIKRVLDCSEHTAKLLKDQTAVKSLYAVKLMSHLRIVGIMVVGFYSDADGVLEQDTILLDRLSEAIGIALDNRMLFEENQRVVLQLQRSNEKLKALDETKDDFISMASHQLRTPLTSVKGYLSMVLEGDAGKLTATERKMLTQAFESSQRMVYLISDLLNVSRLRTGKFVIDATPTNLAKVVEQELGQLKETAAARGLHLTYKSPRRFPQLMLDETKTRQVIMNFVDNAIYYTPDGGTISVELIDKPGSIELRVVDNGIGVPAGEQRHLFTKFYRAVNARKARPDGTGLGLFMAKKVIAAQHGAIIFHSREGKGSTFGFTFSKSRLAPPPTPTLGS
jgi:signal transduction histidine kinase